MSPRLSGHFSIFGLVFFVLKSLLGIATQWSRDKFAILTLKPPSHDKILIQQKWAMVNFPNLPYRPRPMLGNPRQTWILDSTSCWFRIHCHMNLGSGLDSLRWIADSKAHDSRFHMQEKITLHAATLTISFWFSNWICLCNEKIRHWKLCHLLLWWRNRKRRGCPCSIQFCFNSGSTCCFLLVNF